MKFRLVLILALLVLASCESNTGNDIKNNTDNKGGGDFSIEGCIEKVGETTFLVNESKTLIHSNTILIDELIVGNNYRLKYNEILESSPPIINVTNYEEISKDYCKENIIKDLGK